MQLKKNPEVDAKRNSFLYFQIGLALITVLTYIGMEIKTPDPVIIVEKPLIVDNFTDEEPVPLTIQVQATPPPPPPAPEVIVVVDDKVVIEEKKIEVTETNEKENVVVVTSSAIKTGPVGDPDDEDLAIPFQILEDVPLFPNCEKVAKAKQKECFVDEMNKHVRKHFDYPERAKEDNIQGKVSVLMTIDKFGVATYRVRGPKGTALLEKEAERIMSKLPKFTPGKQRGRPTAVTYAIPIMFKLDNR
jgi:periplasmic protein TonB